VVIFVPGCFWHCDADSNCKLARLPKLRLEFWKTKLHANAERDSRNIETLESEGWGMLVVWEFELKDRSSIQAKIGSFLRDEIT
jgi:DNA mismatch endonuclease (patch repair protein)